MFSIFQRWDPILWWSCRFRCQYVFNYCRTEYCIRCALAFGIVCKIVMKLQIWSSNLVNWWPGCWVKKKLNLEFRSEITKYMCRNTVNTNATDNWLVMRNNFTISFENENSVRVSLFRKRNAFRSIQMNHQIILKTLSPSRNLKELLQHNCIVPEAGIKPLHFYFRSSSNPERNKKIP